MHVFISIYYSVPVVTFLTDNYTVRDSQMVSSSVHELLLISKEFNLLVNIPKSYRIVFLELEKYIVLFALLF